MYVSFRIFGRRKLDDQLNIRNIDASCSNISGNQNLFISTSKLVHVMLSDVLRNVTMENGDLVCLKLFDEVIGFSFHLCEDDSSIAGIVFLDKVLYSFMSFASLHEEGVVVNCLRGPDVLVLDHVHSFHVLIKVLSCYFVDPSGNGCRKHDILCLFLGCLAHMPEDLFDIVFESLLKHCVSLINANDLNVFQVESLSFQ